MKLTPRQQKKLNALAHSSYGTFLIEYVELMKGDIADVRNTVNVKPEIANEVRLATVDLLEEFAVQLKKLAGTYERPEDSWE